MRENQKLSYRRFFNAMCMEWKMVENNFDKIMLVNLRVQ